MKLMSLIPNSPSPELDIVGISNDSRIIKPGFMFFAIPGYNADGADYIPDATGNGAVAIVTSKDVEIPGVAVIKTSNPRLMESIVATKFYPSSFDFICAVTGTNGKSSTVNFTRQMWELVGISAASIGTVGVKAAGMNGDKGLTTPDAIDLNRAMRDLSEGGIKNVILETSSHGIEQHRVDNLKIMSAGFTNISNDHLDYYGDLDTYFEAKKRLFSELLDPNGTAVVNADAPYSDRVVEAVRARGIKVITYGKSEGCDILLASYKARDYVQNLSLVIKGKKYDLTLGLVTEFQVYNMMCALGLFITSCPKDWELVMPMLGELKNEAGRIEFVASAPSGAKIFVDFAHNGDGIKKLVRDFRPSAAKNLVCIIGASGDRPEIRRIEIGQALNECADEIIITDDNPRSEDPVAIRAMLKKHCPRAHVIPGREKAISEIIDASRPWDTILICGTMYEADKRFILDKIKPRSSNIGASSATGIFEHSEHVVPGSIFVGVKGLTRDGADFAEAAIRRGATRVIVATDHKFSNEAEKLAKERGVKVERVDSPRKVFADLAYKFYGEKQPDSFVAVTGTSGKSSVVDFVRQIWARMGLPALSSGTIGMIVENVYSKRRIIQMDGGHYTTPVGSDLYKNLAYYKDLGVEHGAIEMSSHGLDQLRAASIKIKAAGFTNLGIDHEAFYGGKQQYLEAKARLFSDRVIDGGTAVLNADVPELEYLRSVAEKRGLQVITYGIHGRDLQILRHDSGLGGQSTAVRMFSTEYELDLKILGHFQLYNLMCAVGLVVGAGAKIEDIAPTLSHITNAVGRLEFMGKSKNGAFVYVDFAYKAEALENTLKTLRQMATGRLIAVFSTCGDILETNRRRELGLVAQNFSDIAIITDDSPRTEDATSIRAAILKHCPKGVEVPTRREAIKRALHEARDGDVILIAGKGHEDFITIGTEDIPYTDQQTVEELLAEGY